RALRGASKEELQGGIFEPLPACWAREPLPPSITEMAEGSFRRRNPPEIKGTGHVVRSLEPPLWALHRATSFRERPLLPVNLGDDADTTERCTVSSRGAVWRDRYTS